MVSILHLSIIGNTLGQKFTVPSGNLYYEYDYFKTTGTSSTHRNQMGIILNPKILGFGFRATLNYHLVSSENNSVSGFTFNLSGSQSTYAPDLSVINKRILDTLKFRDTIAEFDKIRHQISGEKFYYEKNCLRNSLNLQNDSITKGFSIDTSYQQRMETSLHSKDSLEHLYDHYLNVYKLLKKEGAPSALTNSPADSSLEANNDKNKTLDLILSNFKNITLGYQFANLSEISLFNYPLNGISIEYGPKPLYLEYRMGEKKMLNYGNNNFSSIYQAGDNRLWLIQAGIGDKNSSHFHLKYIRHDIEEDHGFYNYSDCNVFGSEFQINITENLKIKYELNGLSGNSSVLSGEFEKAINNMAHQISVSQSLSKNRLRIAFELLKTDEGYINPGNMNLLPGTNGYFASLNSLLFKNRVNYSALYRYTYVSNPLKSIQHFCDNIIHFNVSQLFGFQFSYLYSESSITNEAAKFINRSQGVGFGVNYISRNKRFNASGNGNLTNYNHKESIKNLFANMNYTVSEVYSVVGELGYYTFDGSTNTLNNVTCGLGARANGRKLQIGINGRYVLMNSKDIRADFSQQARFILGKQWDIFLNVNEAFMKTDEKYMSYRVYSSFGTNYKF